MKYRCSLIVVEDINKSRFLYERILGQKVSADYGENVVFEGGFAIHKKEHYQKLIDGKEIFSGSNSFELYFEEDDLQKVQKILLDHGLTFVHQIREQPWKQRVLRFYDYDHTIIEIGESLQYTAYRLFQEQKTPQEISAVMGLPIDSIESAIREKEDYSSDQKNQ